MICRLSQQTMYEIAAPKRPSHQRGDALSVRSLQAHMVTDVDEDVVIAHVDQRELAEVRMGGEVFEGVQL